MLSVSLFVVSCAIAVVVVYTFTVQDYGTGVADKVIQDEKSRNEPHTIAKPEQGYQLTFPAQPNFAGGTNYLVASTRFGKFGIDCFEIASGENYWLGRRTPTMSKNDPSVVIQHWTVGECGALLTQRTDRNGTLWVYFEVRDETRVFLLRCEVYRHAQGEIDREFISSLRLLNGRDDEAVPVNKD